MCASYAQVTRRISRWITRQNANICNTRKSNGRKTQQKTRVFDAKQFACSAEIVLVKLSGSVSSEFVRYVKYVEYFGSAVDIANVLCACWIRRTNNVWLLTIDNGIRGVYRNSSQEKHKTRYWTHPETCSPSWYIKCKTDRHFLCITINKHPVSHMLNMFCTFNTSTCIKCSGNSPIYDRPTTEMCSRWYNIYAGDLSLHFTLVSSLFTMLHSATISNTATTYGTRTRCRRVCCGYVAPRISHVVRSAGTFSTHCPPKLARCNVCTLGSEVLAHKRPTK